MIYDLDIGGSGVTLDAKGQLEDMVDSPVISAVLHKKWGSGQKVMSIFLMIDAADFLKGQNDATDREMSVCVIKIAEMEECACMVKWTRQFAVWSGSVSCA